MDISIKVNELAPFEFKITGTYAGSLIDDLANAFSVDNPSAFFAKQYGFKMPTKIYGVSPFGTFKHGLIFDILKYLKVNYANLNITMTDQVKRIIASRLPLRQFANSDSYIGPQCISETIEMRPYQSEIIDAIITKGYGRCMFECPTGCHAKGTNILMIDGSIKKVEDIVVGDKLVGDDGCERTVLQLCRGKDKMYRIIPTKGIPFIVNGNHILSLVRTDYHENHKPEKLTYKYAKRQYSYDKTKDGYVIDISVNEYLNTSKDFKRLHKLYKSSSLINFDNKQKNTFIIKPYLLGLILGDGCIVNCCSITTMDSEIREYIYEEAKNLGLYISESSKQNTLAKGYKFVSKEKTKGRNIIINELKRLNLFGHNCENKFIPNEYKYGSVETRLNVLAGLIDTDGSGGNNKQSYSIGLKSKQLIDDISFIAKSLGMRTFVRSRTKKCYNTGTIGTYWECTICGENVKLIPLKLNRKLVSKNKANVNLLRTGFSIEELDIDEFYGFILDGNHRYVMADDGFVTHNSGKSFIIANLIFTLQQEYNKNIRTLLFLPNAQLVKQFYKDLIDYGFQKDSVIEFSANSYKKSDKNDLLSKQIVIANRQFLFNHGHEVGDFDMVVIDEVHSASVSTSQTAKFIQTLTAPIKVGCSGTIPTDLAKYWTLLDLTGPVVYKETITHLQDEGFLANVKFVTVKVTDNIVENDKDLLFNLNPRIRYNAGGESQIAFSEPYTAETEYMSKNCMDLYSPILTNPNIRFKNTENTLILFDRIEFGKALFEFLKSIKFNNAQIYYIDGSVPIDERETIRSICETSQNIIIVAQVAVMSTGINIKNLSNLVMTGSSKSQSRTIQSIGRTLRLHGSKSHATIWDIVFNYKYSKKHYLERSALYKKYYNRSKPDEVIKIEIGN